MNETNALSTSIIQSMDDAERAAKAMAASGFFPDSRQAAQAIVKILAGQELGFGPFASMTGVNIIQGKPVLGANFMAAAVKRTGKYNYRIVILDDTKCTIAFLENGKPVGESTFTMDDAKKANLTGKDNWTKYPRNMLFARALSNGQKWYAPDVFNGATVYTPDELGAVTDEDGNVLPGQFKDVEVIPVEHDAETPIKPKAVLQLETAENIQNREGVRYGDIDTETLSHMHRSLCNSLKKNHLSPEEKELQELKRDAAATIIEARAKSAG